MVSQTITPVQSNTLPVKYDEKIMPQTSEAEDASFEKGEVHDVFQTNVDGVEFRTVSWQKAAILFLKLNFAMSILSIPGALAALGSVGGSLCIVSFTSLNTYTALILGDFKHNHPECHTLADMMARLWGQAGRELVGVMIIIAQVLVSAAGVVTTATAFNALSNHSACTVVFALASTILITLCSSVRTFSKLGWITWFGFVTFFISVFVFCVAVSQTGRPAAAPQTGDFDLGWNAIAYPGFVVGMLSVMNIFVSTCGSSMFIPIIAEMKRPQDYRKACLVAGFIVGVIYLSFSLVMYRYLGRWTSVPAFGSAGPLFKKIAYSIALPGLVIGVGLYQHVAAKYAFVRILRNSKHLQSNSITHWSTWLAINIALGGAAFLVAEAVPILNYLLGIAAAICFAPFSLVFPGLLYLHDYKGYRSGTMMQKIKYTLHVLIILLGCYLIVSGIYATAQAIKDAFASGSIQRVFDCADNSGSSV